MKQRKSRIGHIAVMQMAHALLEGPQTIEDLIEAAGLCSTTQRHYILCGRRQKLVYVAEWQADARGRLTARAYMLGKKRDAARPVLKRDNAARMRDYSKRKRLNNVLHLLAA